MLSQHDTNLFARCVELSTINSKKQSTWVFLSGVKKSGVPLSRSILVKQVQKDIALLGLLTSYIRTIVKIANYEETSTSSLMMKGFESCLSVYTAIILEVVKLKPLSDAQLRNIYPSIIRFVCIIYVLVFLMNISFDKYTYTLPQIPPFIKHKYELKRLIHFM